MVVDLESVTQLMMRLIIMQTKTTTTTTIKELVSH